MLNMNPVVQVNVQIGASVTSTGVFDIGSILTPEAGSTTPLTTTTRFAMYESLSDVASGVSGTKPGFESTTETYKAAAKYFGTNPAPASLAIIFFDTTENTTETPVTAFADAIDKGLDIYGLYYIPKESETTSNIKTYCAGLVSALESLGNGMFFYGETGAVSTVVADGSLMRAMAATNSRRCMGMYCTSQVNDAAGLMGLCMGLSRTHETSAFSLCYKSISSATANSIMQTEVAAIKAINGNVYVQRTKAGAKLENGATASGMRFDEVLFVDRIAKDMQNGIYALIADIEIKLPQTDSTSALFMSEIYSICESYYNYGVLADAVWRNVSIGSVNTGDIVEHGYTAFVRSFDEQTTADRAAHKAMPITVLICLSGSVESIQINLNVQT